VSPRPLDWSSGHKPAIVSSRELTRHRALVDEAKGFACVFIAQGPPRAWSLALAAAITGVISALEKTTSAEAVLASAAASVRLRASSILDSDAIRADAVALNVGTDGIARITEAGSCRAYLHRRGELKRLSTRRGCKEGLAEAFVFPEAECKLESGDLLVLAPSHIFGVQETSRLSRLLLGGDASAREVVSRLLASPSTTETGGAVATLRVS